ncbi:MAG: hypothetical protein ORN51_13275 [Akkermansiaceae bacterium]|nr:hypothetical protein [Akkermansiaceae bacterium]
MHPSYLPVFFWSLIIFVSFLGYGETLRRALNRSEFDDLGWGLTSAWGMATILAIGGLLMAFHLANTPILTAVVVLGAALGLFYGVGSLVGGKVSRSTFQFPLSDLILYLLAAVAFASSIAWSNQIDPNDDLICYLMLPKKILATGTLIEPFSFQRAGTFGGQALLQALVMIVGAERNGHVPDRGLAMVMMFGLLVHATRGLRGQQAVVRFLLLFAFWLVPVPRISTNGAITGGILFIGMLETLERAFSVKSRKWLAFIPVGLLLAGACSIRPTFTVVAGAVLLALALRDLWGSYRSGGLPSAIAPFATIGLTALAVLAPFMVVLYASNGTPMVPPFSGFVSKAFQTYSFQEPLKNITGTLAFFTAPEALAMMALLAVAAFYPVKRDTKPILWGTLIASGVILHRFSALAFLDLYRYLYPIFVPLAMWMIAALLQQSAAENQQDSPNEPIRMPIAASAAALLFFIIIGSSQGGKELNEQITGLPDQMKEVKPFFDPNLKKAYDELQGLVPAGEKILTMVDASYWLDYKRNPMFSINAVGGSSPPPGIPFKQGPDALASYFKGLGIRYVIAVDFNNAVLLYTRKLWNESTRPEWFYTSIWKPRFNDFMDNIDALAAKEGRLVAKAGNARLIDLGK